MDRPAGAQHRHCERSEAIQGKKGKETLDCFVASLLAMTLITRDMTSRSRDALRPSFLRNGFTAYSALTAAERNAMLSGILGHPPSRVTTVEIGEAPIVPVNV